MKYFLGIDVGSVTLKIVICNQRELIEDAIVMRSHGNLFKTLKTSLRKIYKDKYHKISGIGVTGSARNLVEKIIGADIVKNEITAQWRAITHLVPKAKTIIEIGGQDSKLIQLKNKIMTNFAMNTVCAAGTGSFLDQQANRLKIKINDVGGLALKAKKTSSITGRCTVFAESDIIQKQQIGEPIEDILCGLCDTLVINYLNNLAKNLSLNSPIVFVGGVAANKAIVKSFEKILQKRIYVPKEHFYTGAYGTALMAKKLNPPKTKFRGWQIRHRDFDTSIFYCQQCPNNCEITKIKSSRKILGYLGSRCQKYL